MRAILQVPDTGPLESLAVMCQSVGIKPMVPSDSLLMDMRSIGCDTIMTIRHLMKRWGYEQPFQMEMATKRDMKKNDVILFDMKGHRSYDKIVGKWPILKGKIIWYRINGGYPEHVVDDRGDHGDECNPPCPVLTPNRWYAEEYRDCNTCEGTGQGEELDDSPGDYGPCWACEGEGQQKVDWYDTLRYSFWPYFHRAHEYFQAFGRPNSVYSDPICLIHNLKGWGYEKLIKPITNLGVKMYGTGSPDGLVNHKKVPGLLGAAKAMVHLKSSDAPGYALLEAIAARCPIVCTRRLIWRCNMSDLLVPGETCLTFDRCTHDALTEEDVKKCTKEVKQALERLDDPEENRRIGNNAWERWMEVSWDKDNADHVSSFRKFINTTTGANV